jgi:hypothetical protein
MALPTLTLTDPQNLDADMSLPMSPTIKSLDTFTSFEFERSSGRPGTASSVGDGAGKYVIIMIIINPPSRCGEMAKRKEALSFMSWPVSQTCFPWLVHVGSLPRPSKQCKGWRMRMRSNRDWAELS